MPSESAVEPESPTGAYELLPPSSGAGEQQQSLMGQEEQVLKSEGRQGDVLAACTALVSVSILAIVTWIAILSHDPSSEGWFAFHPTLQTLALVLFTYGARMLKSFISIALTNVAQAL
ncbi:hypothetical protein C0991_009779 [Blastosporella zonata]|nr:hypothetical protein C0991_009779 [Blastosporella zonata]